MALTLPAGAGVLPSALVDVNSIRQITRPSILQEEKPMADSSERSSAKTHPGRRPLSGAIGQTGAHVMQREVEIGMMGDAAHYGEHRRSSG